MACPARGLNGSAQACGQDWGAEKGMVLKCCVRLCAAYGVC